MATFVNDLRLTELATGEGSGSWGTTTNTNLELIAESFSFGTEAITTNADTHTTTIADGSTDPGRSIFLKYTGTLDSACTITIGPNTVSKLWFIENATSGSQNIIVSQGSGANITIPNGQTKAIYSDGAGSGAAMVDAFQDLSIPDLFIDDDLTIGDDLVFSSDSAVITFGADGDTTLTHTDGSGLTLNSTNKLMFNDASQFIQGSSATVLSLGATDEIDLTATAIDVNGTIDVSGNATLGGTLGVTGAVTANAGVSIDNITIDGTEIDLSSGDLTIDVAGDIKLDAAGNDWIFLSGGTAIGRIINSSSDFVIQADVADKDIIFKGDDGGSGITALTLDMSLAGIATFNSGINIGNRGSASDPTLQSSIDPNTGVFWGGSDILGFASGGSEKLRVSANGVEQADGDFLYNGGGNFDIKHTTAGQNIVISTAPSGGSATERLRFTSDGNVLVGKSTTALGTAGLTFGGAGFASLTRDGAEPLSLNRLSDDGKLAVLYAAGTEIGSLFTNGGAFVVKGNSASAPIQIQTVDGNEDIEVDPDGFIKMETAGAERLRIDASGNVGIGQDSPSTTLHLKKTNDSPIITMENSSTATSSGDLLGGLQFKGNDATTSASGLRAEILAEINNTSGACSLVFKTAGTAASSADRLTITSSGNFLPATVNSQDLGDNGSEFRSLYVDTSIIASNALTIDCGTDLTLDVGGGDLNISDDGTSLLSISNAGSNNVQISTAIADGDLLFKGVDSSSVVTALSLDMSDAGQGAFNAGIVVNDSGNNHNTRFESANDSNALFIDAANDRVIVGASAATSGTDFVSFDARPGSTGQLIQCGRDDASLKNQIIFTNPNGTVGSVQTSGTATAYNTSSDERLKENITDAEDAGTKVDRIKVRQFDWKTDGAHQDYGMVAQELNEVAPEAVSRGENEDEMWAVDYSKLVPMLVKEIQSLRNRVAELEGE